MIAPFLTRVSAVAVTGLLITAAAPAAESDTSILKFTSAEPARRVAASSRGVALSPAKSAGAGGVETFTERYPNGKVKIERQVALDSNGNYVNHGVWKMFNATGKVVAQGQYEMGRRSGVWSRWLERNDSPVFGQAPFNRFQAPFLSQAKFSDGILDGEWTIYDASKQKCSLVSIRNGSRDGLSVVWAPGGKVLRQTNYANGIPVGDVLQMNPKNGEIERAATYIKGRQVISKTSHYRRGGPKKTEAQFLAPKTVQVSPDDYWKVEFARYENDGEHLRHGPSRTWHADGQLQLEGQFENDRRVGHFTYWHPNSQKAAEGKFVDDKHDGSWVWWHENGQKAAVGHYEAGALVGRWRWWDDDGKLAKQMVYDQPQSVADEEPQPTVEVGSLDDLQDVKLRF